MGQGVSREQIARAKEIGIEEYILTHEPNNVKRIGRAYYLKDHDSIEISNGLWNWHSHEIGGKNVIDYLIFVRGYCFVDAVRHLAGGEIVVTRPVAPKARPPTEMKQVERESLRLPPRNADNKRVIAYLQSRGIDREIVQNCIERGSLYETATFHNACFVGRDKSGKTRFAAMRGTEGDFKRDADGSDKRYGFWLPPRSPANTAVAVFESPIDALSHVTIEPKFDGWRLSLGGTALVALTHFLEQRPEISDCVVCTDNDDAGNRAAAEIRDKLDTLGIANCRALPPLGKDWNETLMYTQSEVKFLEDKRKDIRFITSDYKTLFTVKDGDSIRFTSGYDGEVQTLKCRFIDEAHLTLIGKYHNDYHICELAEILERNGSKCEPITGQKPTLNILAAKYGEDLQAVEIPMTDASIRKLVGGKYNVELLYVDGQGINGNYGARVHGAVVRGKEGVAVCGVGGDDNTLTSLHPYWAQKYIRELSPAERPATPEKADFLGKIDKFKEKAAAQLPKAANPDKLRAALE
jgi:hypothetical protein